MEVSGVTGNVTQPYHDDDNNQCAQCEEESGQVSPSAGFCKTCNDFLCSACIKQHRTFRGTRYHKLLEGDNMPLKRPTPTDVELCSVHQDRAVEMYCLDEDILGCTLCFSIGHRMCHNVDLISNLSKDVETSEDMKDIQSASDKQKAFSNQIVEKVHELRSTNDNCHSECLQDYHSYHTEMLDMLDKLGSKLYKRANKLKKMNIEKLEQLLNMILLYDQQVVSLVENIDKMLEHVNCQRDQLFIALKKSKNQIIESVKKSEQLTSELYIELFHFSCDFSTIQLLATNCKLVSFKTEAQPVSEGSRDINGCAREQTCTATCKELIKKNNNVSPEPTTASIYKGSIEIDSNVGTEPTTASTFKGSIKKNNNVSPEQTTASISKGSIKKRNNVSPEQTTASTSKGYTEKNNSVGTEQTTASTYNGSIKKGNNVSPEQTTASTSKGSIEKINSVGTEPTTASTSKGSIEIDNYVASDTASPSTYNESIEKDNSVGPEQTTASTSKGSIKKNNNVSPETTTASTSKGSIEIDNNVASDTASTSTSKGSIEKNNNVSTEQTTASISKGSIKKNNNVSTEPTTALISKGSIEIDSIIASDTASPSTSKGSMEKNNNVSPKPTTAPVSEGSIKKNNNVIPEPTTASTSKGSIEKNNNVSTEPTTASTSKGSIGKNNNVDTEQTTASTSKGSVKKGNNVGVASTTPPASEESKVKETQPGSKCKGNEQKNEHFRQEALANVCEATSLMNIKSPEDKYNCCISGMALISQSQLILSDRNNVCLKLIDIDRGKIIKRQHLKSTPWDVSLMPESRVAVSLPGSHEIQIYTADRNLHNCKSLRVAGRCRGLDCSGYTIAVSFSGPAMVQILDLMGNVMKTIQHDSSGKLLFCAPLYLTISLDNKRIYVSDKGKNTITCVDSEQGVFWVYRDEKLKLPCDLTLEDNRCLYVCSLKNHTIHMVSPDGVCRAIIPNSQSGVQCPQAVCYSGNKHTLYISSELQNSDQRNCIQKLRLQ